MIDQRLNISEVAVIIERSEASIERDYGAGNFPRPAQVRKGGRRYWLKSTVMKWLDEFYNVTPQQ